MSIEDIFDITKNVAISSPAGSGKTEKLARRYVKLIISGAEPEKIVAFTFTEKAAQEMKERVFKILKTENPDIWKRFKDRPHRFRISTIHSFPRGMLLRFPYEALVDPEFEILDESRANLWLEEIIHESLLEISKEKASEEYEILMALLLLSSNSWAKLKTPIRDFFAKRPFSEKEVKPPVLPDLFSMFQNDIREYLNILINAGHGEFLSCLSSPLLQGGLNEIRKELVRAEFDLKYLEGKILNSKQEAYSRAPSDFKSCSETFLSLSKNLFQFDHLAKSLLDETRTSFFGSIFKLINKKYEEKKTEMGFVDFADLESKTLNLINKNERCFEVLFAFDENTDHILVDEFQDTNSIQWEIINKFTEEWRSGYGYKSEKGITPTIFIVGDPKQSIYLFRGANVEIFEKAKSELKSFNPDNFVFYEPPENFRSLQSIIDFSNFFFSKIMTRERGEELWQTSYTAFEKKRPSNDKGKVELLLTFDPELKKKKDKKVKEAETIAKRIISLIGKELAYEKGTAGKEENRRPVRYEDITILLRSRTYLPVLEQEFRTFKIPYFVLKGVGFWESLEISLVRNLLFFLVNPFDDLSLYALLKSPLFNFEEEIFLKARFEKGENLFRQVQQLFKSDGNGKSADLELLTKFLAEADTIPSSGIVEQFLKEKNGWKLLWEPQRAANIKKFIKILEGYDREGLLLGEICASLASLKKTSDESKANINVEGVDAVRIMTIHAAKGLQFPIVIVAGIDGIESKAENDGLFIEGNAILLNPKKNHRLADLRSRKEIEEVKRLCYVAVTRARDYLVLSGFFDGKEKSSEKFNFLSSLNKHFEISETDGSYMFNENLAEGFGVLSHSELDNIYQAREEEKKEAGILPMLIEQEVKEVEERSLMQVTEGEEEFHHRHHTNPVLGVVLHKALELLSKGSLSYDMEAIRKKAESLARFYEAHISEEKKIADEVIAHLKTMVLKGLLDKVVLTSGKSFAELPFLLKHEGKIYSGRIDRVVFNGDDAFIYDYKTFPVEEKEIPDLKNAFAFQLKIYREAVKSIFSPKRIFTYLLLTSSGEVVEI